MEATADTTMSKATARSEKKVQRRFVKQLSPLKKAKSPIKRVRHFRSLIPKREKMTEPLVKANENVAA